MTRGQSDEELVKQFVEATSGFSLREIAERLGVSRGTVHRWRQGKVGELQPATRRALEADLGGLPWRDDASAAGEAVDVFASLPALTRFLEGIAPAGEAKDVKMDALEGYRRMITARRSLPHWWPELKRKIEEGEV